MRIDNVDLRSFGGKSTKAYERMSIHRDCPNVFMSSRENMEEAQKIGLSETLKLMRESPMKLGESEFSDLRLFVEAVEQNNIENGGCWSEWDNAYHIAEAYELEDKLDEYAKYWLGMFIKNNSLEIFKTPIACGVPLAYDMQRGVMYDDLK